MSGYIWLLLMKFRTQMSSLSHITCWGLGYAYSALEVMVSSLVIWRVMERRRTQWWNCSREEDIALCSWISPVKITCIAIRRRLTVGIPSLNGAAGHCSIEYLHFRFALLSASLPCASHDHFHATTDSYQDTVYHTSLRSINKTF